MVLKVNVDLAQFNDRTSPVNIKKAQYALMNQAMSDMEKFVPKDQGHLRDSAHIDAAGSHIAYDMPYAKVQFYGMVNGHRIHEYTTPGTSRRWDLKGKSMFMSSWVKAFKEGLK
ncbi:minor capsid protein [Lactiplantibacillus mudanjiangensis]|uniref:Capsid protein [Lactobacillus sp.] n=1 Tax=Lactiplantibacillus mudanjiangensis TaxID=1296538 RepID=A0A660DXV7_9LACO|nr:minor capsid protein [Lactiplantibacillus mudanjiangensis]VDG26349.1 capsid protein [Lactobacillus sp.] [Lactiplantibacillus mudanjiangensis]VDG27873.1 capsid protein [Lactobacillus sp.] [Lactiplantibacillus mudanjiangensis]